MTKEDILKMNYDDCSRIRDFVIKHPGQNGWTMIAKHRVSHNLSMLDFYDRHGYRYFIQINDEKKTAEAFHWKSMLSSEDLKRIREDVKEMVKEINS